MKLILSPVLAEAIRAHAQQDYPDECCGALLGTEAGDSRTVLQIVRLANERTDQRERRFFVSPEQVLQVERQAHRERLLLLGFYHSHPDHPAIPSEYDLQHALPWYSYLIVSVLAHRPEAIRSWRLREDRSQFDEETVSIESTTP
ncbi:MAG: hypothetical protein C4336_09650 [Armatimonadota bacterium]